MEDDDSGLFGIALSSDDDDEAVQEGATAAASDDGPANRETRGSGQTQPPKAARDAQSEEAYQAVRRDYRVKVENGEPAERMTHFEKQIWKTIKLPLGPQVNKHDAQALLHAVEELYFFRRYDEAAQLVRSALNEDGGPVGLDGDIKKTLWHYESKCHGCRARATPAETTIST